MAQSRNIKWYRNLCARARGGINISIDDALWIVGVCNKLTDLYCHSYNGGTVIEFEDPDTKCYISIGWYKNSKGIRMNAYIHDSIGNAIDMRKRVSNSRALLILKLGVI